MNKALTRESEDEDEDGDTPENASPLPAGSKNYMTPAGFARLKDELDHRRPRAAGTGCDGRLGRRQRRSLGKR